MKAIKTLTLLLLISGFAFPLLAQESFTPYVAKVTGESVRLRSGASLAHPPVFVLAMDDQLNVVGETEGWAIVELPAETPCWISSDFVEATNDGAAWKVTGDNVNLRVSADTKFFPVGQSVKGDVLTAAKDEDGKPITENGYARIVPPGNAHGAISLEFIEKVKNVAPEKAETPTATEAGEPAKAEQPTDTVKKDKPAKEPTKAELEDERKTFRELETLLNDELKKPAAEVSLTDIRKMFEQFTEFSLDKDIGDKARLYIEKIDLTVKLIKAEKDRIAEEEAARKAEVDRIAKEGTEQPKETEQPKGPVEYTTTGTVGSTGKTARTPASHRLFDKDGKVLYDLRWDKGDLSKLMGSKVGIVGKVKEYDGWPNKVIVIERVDVIEDGETK